jgi:hypothetical protein
MAIGYGTAYNAGMLEKALTFLRSDAGQDLTEYSLLLVFVLLASAGIFLGTGGSISGIVEHVNSELVTANTSAS